MNQWQPKGYYDIGRVYDRHLTFIFEPSGYLETLNYHIDNKYKAINNTKIIKEKLLKLCFHPDNIEMMSKTGLYSDELH